MILNAVKDNIDEAKREIAKLQRQRDTGEISEEEFDEKYNTVMDNERLKFFAILDGRALESYKTYANT